ncbi:MAG: (Fe-S)-binding protein [Chloroflexota bacterium]
MTAEAKFEQVERFVPDLEQCMKCGFCTGVCPVYAEEKVESSVARGKNMMIRGLLDGSLSYTKEYAERLNKCTLCMACTENCPAKANIPNVIVAARADVVKARGVKFPYNFLYRWILPHRRLFGNVVRVASWLQRVFMPRTQGTIRHLPFFLSALGRGRQIPTVASKFLRQRTSVVNKPPEGVETKFTVGYFTGCMTDYVFPDLGEHIIDFLTRNGVEVVVPKEQGCCGAPAFLGAGDFETGRRLADANVEAFKDVDYIICDCATCTSAIKDYPKFLADTPEREKAYTEISEKIKDITQFVIDILQPPASAYKASAEAKGKKVTWHDPCHLNRHLGIKSQPRELIRSIPDIEYIEMPNADRCCGMAGTFSIYYYELSKKIADQKMESLKSTGADIIATDCPGCQIQFIDNTIRHKLPVKVMHVMELIE